jgi:hypothetical protein
MSEDGEPIPEWDVDEFGHSQDNPLASSGGSSSTFSVDVGGEHSSGHGGFPSENFDDNIPVDDFF